ncbi:hypothetical protein [Spongiactinospora sp. 9N601]|uniref:hypothetical protein n=1 Tax=Spongiactinospora sp. 9N601 TaxID=3375149 RepID=UPI0037B02DC0
MGEPSRQAMEAALARIQRLSDDNWWVLNESCRLMENEAWVGSTGAGFGTDVHGMQKDVRAMLTRAVADARAKLATTT